MASIPSKDEVEIARRAFNMNSTIDIRDAFFDEIYNYAVRDNDVVIITNDMDIFSLKSLKTITHKIY